MENSKSTMTKLYIYTYKTHNLHIRNSQSTQKNSQSTQKYGSKWFNFFIKTSYSNMKYEIK